MKCQQILFLFCVLCVSLVTGNSDEHQGNHRLREKSHQKQHKNDRSHITNKHKKTEARFHSSSHFKQLAYRDGNQHCQVVCGSGSNASDVVILYNGGVGLVGYLNETGKAAVIQDYFTNITVILNGESGSVVVEELNDYKFYAIENGSQEVSWFASKSDFNAFFKNLSSLQNFAKIGREQGRCINSTQEVFKLSSPVVSLLGVTVSETNLSLSIQLSNELNSTLKFIFKGEGSFILHKNIIWFIKVNLAFADLFRENQTQLQSLNVTLNLTSIYGSSSGVEALINLLSQIGSKVDLASLLRNQLCSPEKLLDLLDKLSGGSNEGVDGIITVLVTVAKALNGRASFNDVITAVSNYNSDGDSSSLHKVVEEALELIESQNRQYNNSEAFRGIYTILKAINDNNLVYRNVNVSDIITLLISRNPIVTIQVVIRIFSRFANSDGISQTIRTFIESLNGTNGSSIISRLFPGANIDSARHFFTSIVSQIPVIGNLFNSSSSGFTGGFNISSIIHSNPISGFIQNAAGNGSVGNAVSSFTNASSGIVHGVENAFSSFVGGIFGSGHGDSTTPSTNNGGDNSNSSTGNNGTENSSSGNNTTPSSPLAWGQTENPNPENNGTSSSPSPESGNSTSSNTTEGQNPPGGSGNNGTAPWLPTNNATGGNLLTPGNNGSSPQPLPSFSEISSSNNGTAPPNPPSGNGTEGSNGTTIDDSSSPIPSPAPSSNSTGSTKVASARKGHIHQLHEKKYVHHAHLDASNRKENVHTRHRLREKGHHGHAQASERNEHSHLKHKLQEKEAHHGRLQSRHEHSHHAHKLQEKESIAKQHHKEIHERKHEDHYDHRHY